MTSLKIQKIAILSIGQFQFGIETSQIQEIQTFASSRVVHEYDDGSLLIRLHSSQSILPVFPLRAWLGFPPEAYQRLSGSISCLIFRWHDQFAGCLIEKIENVTAAQLSALHPVPRVLAHLAKARHIWGFYTYTGFLLPLFDLEQIISTSIIQRMLARSVSYEPQFPTEIPWD